jgi:hypothetical protein
MRTCRLLFPVLAMLASFQSFAAQPTQPTQDNKVELTVVKYADHVQFQCNPISLATAMGSDWKAICNQMARPQAQRLAADGTIGAVNGPVFDIASASSAAGPLLLKNIAMTKPGH